MKMTNQTYDKLKLIAWILAPLITFVAALCEIWKIPHAIEITATLAAVDTLLGSLLAVSNKAYNDSTIEEDNEEVE